MRNIIIFLVVIFCGSAKGQELVYGEPDYSYYMEYFLEEETAPPYLPRPDAINDILEDCLSIAHEGLVYGIVDCDFEGEDSLQDCIENALMVWRSNIKECHDFEFWDLFKLLLD